MAYFRKYDKVLATIDSLCNKEEHWLILINADPDAMACAMALERLIKKKVKDVSIARINVLKRPDNLTMERILGIKMFLWNPELKENYQRFAILDSQPHHNPAFDGIDFDIIFDHHPITDESAKNTPLSVLMPELGSCSSFMTELLYNAKVHIGKKLATALQYGIRVDTGSFGSRSTEVDFRAYHYLNKFADHTMLMRIIKSEYLPEWLPFFAQAIENLYSASKGNYCFLQGIQNPDILVAVADFLQKVNGIEWVAVSGVYQNNLVVIFRGNGEIDLGTVAMNSFNSIGSAGGHRQMARAEIPLKNVQEPYAQFVQKNVVLS